MITNYVILCVFRCFDLHGMHAVYSRGLVSSFGAFAACARIIIRFASHLHNDTHYERTSIAKSN